MKETKDRKQVYYWLSQGKKVQVNIDGWTTCSEEGLLRHLLSGSTHSYRVEEIISIGGFHAPKPIHMRVSNLVSETANYGKIELEVHTASRSDLTKIGEAFFLFCKSLED